MRVAILSQASNFHCQKWAQALADLGADVFVYGFTHHDIKNVTVRTLNTFFGYRYPDFWLTAGKLNRLFLQDKIQIVHPLHLTPFGTWGILATGNLPIVAAAIGADVLEYRSDIQPNSRSWEGPEQAKISYWGKMKHYFFKHEVQRVVNQANLITADNQEIIRTLQLDFGVNPEKLRHLRWGIEPELFQLTEAEKESERKKWSLKAGQNLCLIPRGANYFYQADIILEAVQQALHKGLTNWKFIMLSAGYSIAEYIKDLAQKIEYQYPESFTWIPHQISRVDVLKIWQITDAFINAPSYDGFSSTLNEGRFVGAIPIYNHIPAHTELMQDGYNGILVHPFEPQLLSKTLLKLPQLLENKDTFKQRNQQWVLKNAQLKPAAEAMIADFEKLL
ncbi:MAG: glycosyltransferase [Bacteroidia bacterium]|nr:glycosyltransferase [Bacteroidia bacterium]